MPIQFHCPSCGQPIEVDDDAAHQPVTCPYCRRMSTAPASTPANFDASAKPSAPGAARPVSPTGGATYQGASGVPAIPGAHGNTLGWIALGAISAAIVLMIGTASQMAPIQKSVETIQDPAEKNRVLTEELLKHPMLLVVSLLSSCALPLTAAVLATIALVRKRTPRWPAYLTLGLIGAGILLFCLNVIVQTLGGGI